MLHVRYDSRYAHTTGRPNGTPIRPLQGCTSVLVLDFYWVIEFHGLMAFGLVALWPYGLTGKSPFHANFQVHIHIYLCAFLNRTY